MSQKYDIVVIMGSGFRSGEDDRLDRFGLARCLRAIELYKKGQTKKILLTGWLRHEKSGITFINRATSMLMDWGISIEDILIPKYNPQINTRGDVEQIFSVVNKKCYLNVGVITETPHWIFRLNYMLKSGEQLEFSLIRSCAAPWWYWLKEFLYWVVRSNPAVSKLLHKVWNNYLAEHFGVHVSSNKPSNNITNNIK